MDTLSGSFKYKDMRGRRNDYSTDQLDRSSSTAGSSIANRRDPSPPAPHREAVNPIGIYGWRKRSIYCLVLLLIVLVLVNLALTIWILVVLNFNIDGMGKLRVTRDGVRLEGVAEFIEPLITNNITSDENSELVLQSYQNISLSTPNATIRLGPNDIQLTASRLDFEMSSAGNEKQTLLSVTEEELTVQATLVRAGGVQGVSFEGSVETGEIRASGDDKLRVEAPRGSLHLSGDTGVLLRAETGPVDVVASDRLVLSSAGTVSLAADVVRFENLPIQPVGQGPPREGVHQVCICPSGQLFLVPASNQGCSVLIDPCS